MAHKVLSETTWLMLVKVKPCELMPFAVCSMVLKVRYWKPVCKNTEHIDLCRFLVADCNVWNNLSSFPWGENHSSQLLLHCYLLKVTSFTRKSLDHSTHLARKSNIYMWRLYIFLWLNVFAAQYWPKFTEQKHNDMIEEQRVSIWKVSFKHLNVNE